MVCRDFILPEPASYVFFYAIFNLHKLLYIIAFPFLASLLFFTELDIGKVAVALRRISDDLKSLDREHVTNAMVKLEQTFAELTPEERYKKRLEQEKPVLDALLSWANEMQAKTVPKSTLSSNRAERSIKPFVMGRKNQPMQTGVGWVC